MAQWLQMGSPMYPTLKQINQLKDASIMKFSDISYVSNGNTIEFNLNIPAQGVASITFAF